MVHTHLERDPQFGKVKKGLLLTGKIVQLCLYFWLIEATNAAEETYFDL